MDEVPAGSMDIEVPRQSQARHWRSLSFLDRETDWKERPKGGDENGTRVAGCVKREHMTRNSSGRTEQTFPLTAVAAASVYLLAFTSPPKLD